MHSEDCTHLFAPVTHLPQEKDAKVNYLRKIIDVVSIVMGQPVPAKPNKVCKRVPRDWRSTVSVMTLVKLSLVRPDDSTQLLGCRNRLLWSVIYVVLAFDVIMLVCLQIVAGLEPENTNIFLQMLGQACRMSDGSDAVRVSCTDSAELLYIVT